MTIIILRETLSYLRFNCIWPKEGHELNPGKWFYIRFLIMLSSTSVILIGSSAHLVVSLENKSGNIFEDLVILIGEMGVFYFNAIYVTYQQPIAKIYAHLSDFKKFGMPTNFERRNKNLMFWSKLYKTFIDIVIFNMCIESFLTRKSCEKENMVREFKEICGLVVTTWVPFNIEVFPFKHILYFWQCCTLLLTLKGAALISYSVMESMEHLIVRIQHLKSLLVEAVDTEDEKLRNEKLAMCVEYHNDIFEIGRQMDKNFAMCLFVHVLFTGALFGCIGYKVLESFSLLSFSLFSGWVLSFIIVSVSGQRLMEEALSVGDVAYNSNWYDHEASFQKNISFIITRSRIPILIHAGPLSYLSHVMMLTIFKTAYTYLAMLNTTSN